jgi:hypothetical protein
LPVAGRITPKKHFVSTNSPTYVPWPRESTGGRGSGSAFKIWNESGRLISIMATPLR